MNNTRGQSTMELAVLVAVVAAAILAMQFYAKHAVEGRMKQSSDQVGDQFDIKKGNFVVSVTNTSKRNELLENSGLLTSTIDSSAPETNKRETTSFTIPKPTAGDGIFED